MDHDIYRTISETAEELDLPQHVLRFWETKFTQIKPTKRDGGQKFFRSVDLELLHGIRHLLYDKGHTIKGVQKLLDEQGIDWVISSRQEENISQTNNFRESDGGQFELENNDDSTYTRKKKTRTNIETDQIVEEEQELPTVVENEEIPELLPKDVLPENVKEKRTEKSSLGFLTRNRGHGSRLGRKKKGAALTKDEIKRLNEALSELLECKRLLDQARN